MISIRTKSIIIQLVLIIAPVIVCSLLIINQISSASVTNAAGITYQYDRYIIDSLNTSIRQMESTANTLGGNRLVREYVS